MYVIRPRTQSTWSQQHSAFSRLHPWSGCQYGNGESFLGQGRGKEPLIAQIQLLGQGQPTVTSSWWPPPTGANRGSDKHMQEALPFPVTSWWTCHKDEKTGNLKERTPLERFLHHRPTTIQAQQRKLMYDGLLFYFTKEPNSYASFIEIKKKKTFEEKPKTYLKRKFAGSFLQKFQPLSFPLIHAEWLTFSVGDIYRHYHTSAE